MFADDCVYLCVVCVSFTCILRCTPFNSCLHFTLAFIKHVLYTYYTMLCLNMNGLSIVCMYLIMWCSYCTYLHMHYVKIDLKQLLKHYMSVTRENHCVHSNKYSMLYDSYIVYIMTWIGLAHWLLGKLHRLHLHCASGVFVSFNDCMT